MLHIYTLTFNKSTAIEQLKQSLLPNLQDIDFTWHIKDNSSGEDGTYEQQKNQQNINIIKSPNKNEMNFAEGCNYLFEISNPKDEDYILLLNNDISFNDTSSIKNMLSCMRDTSIGIVGAKLTYPNSKTLQHAGVVFPMRVPTPVHYKRNEQEDIHSTKNRYFQAITGAVLLTRAKDYRQCKMDTNLRWMFDDIDFSLQVGVNLKKKIVYCGQTEISHEESASLKLNPINKLHMPHNVNYFVSKWRGKYKTDLPLYLADPNYNLVK